MFTDGETEAQGTKIVTQEQGLEIGFKPGSCNHCARGGPPEVWRMWLAAGFHRTLYLSREMLLLGRGGRHRL